VMNEAQDISPEIYDKRFSPMGASGHATKVFSGTSWTSKTLLAKEKRAALEAQSRDGEKRVFLVEADEVGKANKLYARHVKEEVERLGRNHPFIRTQYFCEEIDAQAGMFHEGRMALMFTADERREEAGRTTAEGMSCAFLIDVAGQDEARMKVGEDAPLVNPGRDSTTLSVVEVDTSTLATLQGPTYRVVERRSWTGENHLKVFGQIQALAERWNPLKIVVDATGVGEGLWMLLDKAYPSRTIPVKFSQVEKSEIGWRFLAIIETGRFRDGCAAEKVREQYAACMSEILPGPGKVLRWGVPEGKRGSDGELLHDDYVLADALVAVLDRLKWYVPLRGGFVKPKDPQEEVWNWF